MHNPIVHCLLNPITRKSVSAEVSPGKRVSELFSLPDNALVSVNGIPDADPVLGPGDIVNIALVPQGGDDGKNIARTGILIAAQIAAAALTQGMSVWAQLGIRTAVAIGSSIGVNALIPPVGIGAGATSRQEEFQRLGSLTGARNRILPYNTIPRVYGKRKIFPPMSARPHTDIVANEQFLNLLFSLGPGPLRLSEPKIGDTVIGSFDTDNNFTSNGNFDAVLVDVAESPGLYANQVSEEAVGVNLDALDDQAIRTTELNTDRLGIDFVFPQGLFSVTNEGKTKAAWVNFQLEMRKTGTTTWELIDNEILPTDMESGFFTKLVRVSQGLYRATSQARETLRVGFSLEVKPGQYDIRVTRKTADGEGYSITDPAQVFDAATFTTLRSTTYEKPTDMPGVAQLAMRIKATDQLNGILDTFSVVAESALPVYDGAAWDQPVFDPATGAGTGGVYSSNPAWAIADVLTGDQNAKKLDLARLDADSFKDFADACTATERECNIVLDSPRTVLQTISLISATGRGSLAIQDGQYAIIQDVAETIPVQHFTPRNSFDFSAVRSFPDVPHALRVNFINPDKDWQTDEAIVYDDGYSFDGANPATIFESIDLEGVTSYDQAWKEGRYRLAEARLRPERYSFSADIESIVCQRGDLIRVSHDVTLWGINHGRIKEVTATTLTLDEPAVMESGKDYNIRVRLADGSSVLLTATTDPGAQQTVTVPDTTGIAPGDLFMFGEQGTETAELKVFSIEPMNEYAARITAVDASPGIYSADTGAIPPFESNMTYPVDLDRAPDAPGIRALRSDNSGLYRDADGSPVLRLLVDFETAPGMPTEIVEAEYRKTGDS
ncbi:MAG: phage tail protein, partial [Lentisphaerae bacterium]|nr:phage tail protein [Lentisphaerota bacterium]